MVPYLLWPSVIIILDISDSIPDASDIFSCTMIKTYLVVLHDFRYIGTLDMISDSGTQQGYSEASEAVVRPPHREPEARCPLQGRPPRRAPGGPSEGLGWLKIGHSCVNFQKVSRCALCAPEYWGKRVSVSSTSHCYHGVTNLSVFPHWNR